MPFIGGLQAAITVTNATTLLFPLLALVLYFATVWLLTSCKTTPDNKPIPLPYNSLFAVWPFFRRRFDFLNDCFRITGQPIFQFQLLQVRPNYICANLNDSHFRSQNTVVVVSGESARQTFFSAPSLDLTEGFKILSGAVSPDCTFLLLARR